MSRNYLGEPIFFTPPPSKFDRRMYKSGGDAPSPDPQIGRAALENAQLGRDAFDFYKQEYTNQRPNQERLSRLSAQIQEQLVESGRLNNEYAKDYYNYMIETFRPLEKDIVRNANEFDTAGRREQEASQGLSDVRQAFDNQRQITQRNNERAGINPNSGNAQALNQQLDVQEAIAGANAMNQGRKRAETLGNAMKMDAASLGRNLPSNQATSQQIANSSATQGLNAGYTDANNQRAGLGVMGQGFNAAMAGNISSANILNQQYQNQLQGWQAEQENNARSWAGLGTLAGVMMTKSDVNIKKNISPIDENKALEGVKNTEISSWQYDKNKTHKNLDEKTHIGAMAQDLQKNFGNSVSNGKEIDLISVVGANMAATKALAEKVDKLMGEPKGYKDGGLSQAHQGPGEVSGPGTKTSDSIPAMLSNGEFVVNAEATELIGLDVLNKLNERGLKIREGSE